MRLKVCKWLLKMLVDLYLVFYQLSFIIFQTQPQFTQHVFIYLCVCVCVLAYCSQPFNFKRARYTLSVFLCINICSKSISGYFYCCLNLANDMRNCLHCHVYENIFSCLRKCFFNFLLNCGAYF